MNAKSMKSRTTKTIRPVNRADLRRPLTSILSERRHEAIIANEKKIIMSEFKLHFEPGVVARIADYRQQLRQLNNETK